MGRVVKDPIADAVILEVHKKLSVGLVAVVTPGSSISFEKLQSELGEGRVEMLDFRIHRVIGRGCVSYRDGDVKIVGQCIPEGACGYRLIEEGQISTDRKGKVKTSFPINLYFRL